MVFEDTTRIGVPANRLLIADRPDLFKVMANARLLIVAALIAVLLVVLASRRRRGALAVYLAGGLVLALYAVWAVLGVVSSQPENLERARVIALALVPFAFLAGLLRSRVGGAAAVSALVGRLGRGAPPRGQLAAPLGGPPFGRARRRSRSWSAAWAGARPCATSWRPPWAIPRWSWRTGRRPGSWTPTARRSRCVKAGSPRRSSTPR